ncbi:hypothetical protein Ddye_008704 [Dipteronia dyeriana]|uniref:Major facilitator superfamily (MFS) profile domain-containing protein n=1 Tax=Dipteronia dyeriana TaxID=168575 RepID=A0AAD9XAC5_9ROSI|nr:hypothetical protein Ddye_008704 [Dipteronia dyeriana]
MLRQEIYVAQTMEGEQQNQQLVETANTVEVPAETLEPLTMDEVIEKHIGSFGWSQFLHVFLVSLAWIFDSQSTLVTIFSDAEPSSWKSSAVNGGNHDNIASVCGLKPGSWEWVGGHKISTIAQWNLVCERKFLAAIPASLFFLGSLLGSAVFGQLADTRLGRKKTVLVSCVLTSATFFFTSLSPNIWIYSLLRCANGFARSGIGIACLVLSTEVVGRKWRGQVGQYGFFLFTVGFISLPLIAYPTRNNWRTLHRILAIFPMFYSLFLLPFISESPRWLLVRGKNKESIAVLKRFAKLNGKELPTNLTLADVTSNTEAETYGNLWTTKWAAKRLIIVMIAGFGIGFVYYGVQLNVENLNFSIYFTVAVNAIMEIPAVLIGTILLSFTSRRFLFSISAFLAGVSCFLCIIFSKGSRGPQAMTSKEPRGSWPQLSIEALGFMAASTAYDILYIYCVELFPTNVRNFAMSFMRQALMLGASVSPLLVALGRLSPSLSFIIFGALSIFSGFVSFWLPETKDAPLFETLKQQGEEEKRRRLPADDSALELGNETKITSPSM